MAVLTTQSVRPEDRFAYWREVITQQFVHLRPERVDEKPFHGEIRASLIGGGLSISRIASGGQRVYRTRREIARSPEPLYFVNLQLADEGSFRQGQEEQALRCGDIFVVDAVREFELGCERPFSHVSLKLPQRWLDARLGRPDLAPGALVRRSEPLARLLASVL